MSGDAWLKSSLSAPNSWAETISQSAHDIDDE